MISHLLSCNMLFFAARESLSKEILLMMNTTPSPKLWRHADFLKLWAGSTVSLFGSQITFLAIPFTAILVLHASAAQMSLLVLAESLPSLLIGLFAGVWVDRWPRRLLLIVADIGRALLLGSIPLMVFLGLLRIEYLYIVAFLVGTLTLFFNVAYGAFLPALIDRKQLVDGNSKLEASSLLAQIAGPALAGWLIQLLTAPLAILVDACSFLVSACSLGMIRTQEPRPERKELPHFWRDLGEGLRILVQDPLLRPIAACDATLNFFGGMMDVVRVLYIVQVLHLGAFFFGIMFSIASMSALVGSLFNSWLTRKLGIGCIILLSAFTLALGWLLIPLAGGPPSVTIAVIVVGSLLFGISNTLFNVNTQSLRQQITPNGLLGRVGSCMQFIGEGTLPIGALIGGVLGQALGLRTTFIIACCGLFFAFLWVLFSPIRGQR